MSNKTEHIEKILNDFYNEEYRNLENGYADVTPWAEKIESLFNKPASSDMKFPIRLLNDRLRNYRHLHRKLGSIGKKSVSNALSQIIERKDKECQALEIAISALKRINS